MTSLRLLFPGSFDPPHLGHVDVARRAAALAAAGGGRLILGIAANPDKPGLLPVAQRIALLQETTAAFGNVDVATYPGATVHFARDQGITSLVRGLRNHLDLEDERAMAEVNRQAGFDTIFLLTTPEYAHLSSRLVRNVRAAGLDVAGLVPPAVAAALDRR